MAVVDRVGIVNWVLRTPLLTLLLLSVVEMDIVLRQMRSPAINTNQLLEEQMIQSQNMINSLYFWTKLT